MIGVEWLVIAVMILLNGLLAAFEIALASVSLGRLQLLAEMGRPGAATALAMKQSTEASFASVQLGITMVGLIAGATGGAGASAVIEPELRERFGFAPGAAELLAVVLVVVPVGALTIVVGELVPKIFALKHKEWTCLRLAPPMRLFTLAVYPIVWMFETAVSVVMRGVDLLWRPETPGAAGEPIELEELRAVLALARASRLIGGQEERIILRASRLSSRSTREIAIPPEEIAMLSLEQRLSEAFLAAHREMHTRYLVSERVDDFASTVGYVNFKDIVVALTLNPQEPSLRGILRELTVLDGASSIGSSLERMIRERVHIALVRDGSGLVGMVTLEDILEQLVGEIEDEYDRLPLYVRTLGAGWLVGGGVTLARLRELVGDADGDPAESVSDWVRRHTDEPKAGGEFVAGGVRVFIRKVRRKRVVEAQFTPIANS